MPQGKNSVKMLGSTHDGDEPLGQQHPSKLRESEKLTPDQRIGDDRPPIIEDLALGFNILAEHAVSGTDLDSSSRHPPPRCHPGTRAKILARIIAWVRDIHRRSNLLWLYGPVGVGKSAIAQTIAEYCRDELGQLGAAFFFSKNVQLNPEHFIPTLAYQLAIRFPPYKPLISQLVLDRYITLGEHPIAQFKKLIAEPFELLTARKELHASTPLLMIVDGLDEWRSQQAQSNVIQAIGEQQNPSLLWVICSRPEAHLKIDFLNLEAESRFEAEEITTRGDSEDDVLLFLQDSFRSVRETYWDVFDVHPNVPWPSNYELRTLAKAASGLILIATIAVDFVGDPRAGDPRGQLETFLGRLESGFSEAEANPLLPLDRQYTAILSSIPTDSLPAAMRLLGFCAYYPNHPLSLQEICNFFSLDPFDVFGPLRKIHSLVDISPLIISQRNIFNLYHTSFATYLRDPSRSDSFHVPEANVHSDVAYQSLRWYKFSILRGCHCSNGPCCPPSNRLKPQWLVPDEKAARQGMDNVGQYAFKICWKACLQAAEEDVLLIYQELSGLSFCPTNTLPHRRDRLMDVVKRIYYWRFLLHTDRMADDHDPVDGVEDVGQNQPGRNRRPLGQRDALACFGFAAFALIQHLASSG